MEAGHVRQALAALNHGTIVIANCAPVVVGAHIIFLKPCRFRFAAHALVSMPSLPLRSLAFQVRFLTWGGGCGEVPVLAGESLPSRPTHRAVQ